MLTVKNENAKTKYGKQGNFYCQNVIENDNREVINAINHQCHSPKPQTFGPI